MSSKTNALNIWKWYFLVFRKLLRDEVETASWESETKHQKLFKSKFYHMKLLRKWFWSYLELKNECSERLKTVFFSYFANFWVTKLKPFSGKARQSLQDHLNSKLVIGSFLENGFEVTLGSKTNILSISKGKFSVFCNFWVTKLKQFSGKVRQNIKNCLNQNLVIGAFLENGFEPSLSSRTNIVGIWK